MKHIIDADKLRVEIERRKELLTPHKGQGVGLCREIIKQFDSLLSFIDNIPQPIMKDDIIDEIHTELERRFTEYNHDSSHHIQAAECASILDFLDSLQHEQPKLYKDESLGSPDYERGFKHGRDYQTEVTRKYTNKDKVIAYLVDKGYPVSTNGEIPTYQEIFDMINNAIKHANKHEQPEVDLEKEIERFYGMYRDEEGEYRDLEDNGIVCHWYVGENQLWIEYFARHFYELGFKAKKGGMKKYEK